MIDVEGWTGDVRTSDGLKSCGMLCGCGCGCDCCISGTEAADGGADERMSLANQPTVGF